MDNIIIYLIVLNITALAIMGADKKLARSRSRRIPESVLLTLSFIGGSVGALVGMFAFRHKTRHLKFIVLLPLFFVLHCAIALILIR